MTDKYTDNYNQVIPEKKHALGGVRGRSTSSDLGESAYVDGGGEVGQSERDRPVLVHPLGMGTFPLQA